MMDLALQTVPGVADGLLPAAVLALTALVLFGIDIVSPEEDSLALLGGVSAGGSLLAFGIAASLLFGGYEATPVYGAALVLDGTSLFFTLVFTSVTALVSVASYDYLRDQTYRGEFYALVLFAATGMSLMAAANSLATAFVALELTSLPSYALVAFLKRNEGSVEAGLKYFLVGALSSAVLVFGMSLVYAATGAMTFGAIAEAMADAGDVVGVLGLGVVMIAGGVAFKMAAVPFHFWAPEAYEGAPAPISAFISSASKAAGFVIAFRVFTVAFTPAEYFAGLGVDWVLAFQVLAVVTMTLGNFAAATQENVKRMLAYSSIGHAGYVLIGLASLGGVAAQGDTVLGASIMHLFVYGFMNTGAFLFIALVEYWGVGRTFEDYAGLGRKAPVACAAMTVFLFSLAGLPVGAGFLSKYVLFFGAVSAGFWWLAAVGAINSALSLYYYTRVVKAMWVEEPNGDLELQGRPTGLYAAVVAAAVVTVLLLPGFFPIAETAIEAANAVLPNAGDTTTAFFG